MDQISSCFARKVRVKDDRGIALVVAIALMAIVGILMITMVTVAINESRASGRDRQRSSAVMTAEGQVDSIISKIQSAPLAGGLPCGASTVTGVPVGSDKMTITNTVTYYTSAGAPVLCSVLATTPVAQAKIKSTSSSNRIAGQASATRTVETLLNLKPSYANALNKAIFSNGTDDISFVSNATIFGEGGLSNADIYTNGNVTCNSGHFYGSIYTQKGATFAGACIVEVNLHTKLGYTSNNGAALVKGDVLASGGSIALGSSQVPGHAYASGTATGTACTATKCFGSQTVAAPPTQAFPQYLWNPTTEAAWAAQGYAVVKLPNSSYPCGNFGDPGPLNGKVDGVAHWIYDNQATMGKTVIYANCPGQPVKFQGINISLNANLAIFATGGFNFSSNTQIASNSSTHRLLYLVQPYNSVSQPCTVDGISLDNQVTVADTVDDLLYSPCNIRKANNTTHYGQIYAGGSVRIDNQLTMYYKPLPPFGLSASGGSVDKYTVDILYMRETTP